MTPWPQNPSWTNIANINAGQQYKESDGITYEDMNAIIQNMMYLKTHGNQISVDTSSAYVSGDTLFLTLKEI